MEESFSSEPRSELFQKFLESEQEVHQRFYYPLSLNRDRDVLEMEQAHRRRALELLNLPQNFPQDNPEVMKRVLEVNTFIASLPEKQFHAFDSDFARTFLNSVHPDVLLELERHFSNKIIVDLGCGTNSEVLRFFETSAQGYIGVDLGVGELRQRMLREKESREYPVSLISDDMLHFVSSLPDNSANFFMSGIDSTIVKNSEYRIRLGKEISRATEKGGVFFVNCSDTDILESAEKAGLKPNKKIGWDGDLSHYFFTKEK